MSHIELASNAQLTDPLISASIGHATTSDALEFGMAKTVRLFHIVSGDLK
jgi:pyridoxine 5'-phosphate synthase PdxJ